MRLHFDTPQLVGEAGLPSVRWPPALALTTGVVGAVGCVAVLLAVPQEGAAAAGLGALSAAGFLAAALLERHVRRQRRFVIGFTSHTLRLDFTTVVRGLPRTMVVPFQRVRDIAVLEQADQRFVLTVDFEDERGGLFREVLVANVTGEESETLQRLRSLLRAAIGLS